MDKNVAKAAILIYYSLEKKWLSVFSIILSLILSLKLDRNFESSLSLTSITEHIEFKNGIINCIVGPFLLYNIVVN